MPFIPDSKPGSGHLEEKFPPWNDPNFFEIVPNIVYALMSLFLYDCEQALKCLSSPSGHYKTSGPDVHLSVR